MSANNYRRRAIRKYGKECSVCGSTENIEVHHIDANRGNNDIENLRPLCKCHHQKVHRQPIIPRLGGDRTDPEVAYLAWHTDLERHEQLYGPAPKEVEVDMPKDVKMALQRLVWFQPGVNNLSQAVQYCVNHTDQIEVLEE